MPVPMTKSGEVTCPHCEKRYIPDLAQDPAAVRRWKAGALIQHVWPDATSAQREQMISGICSDFCWNAYLGGE